MLYRERFEFKKFNKTNIPFEPSLHLGDTESRKNIEQKFIFQIGTLSPCGINERFSFL